MKKILSFLWLPLVLQGCDGSLNSNQEELDQFVLDSSIWTVQLGTGTNDSAQGLSIDSQKNLYLAGYTSGNLQE
ncbi:MAG: SBBP repeat-containing protein, partial [SAR324 cluster bacterium]|nr:SBBP repeat-containing protein [SAR324 cluster bacterium]